MLKEQLAMRQNTYSLCFDDILLLPQYSDIESRSEVDISASITDSPPLKFKVPIISSPMDTVTEGAMAIEMARCGALGIIHRYNTIKEQSAIVKEVRLKTDSVAAAIGVSGDFLERAQAVVSEGTKLLCIDVAHGHHVNVERAIKTLKDRFAESVAIMAGNVATAAGCYQLDEWGADAIRVGVGGGSICSTRIQTGHGVPTYQSVWSSKFLDINAKIIADGGIRNSGDIVKALSAGADFVMLGSLLSGTTEAPGEVINDGNGKFKVYRGMASREAQMDWKGEVRSHEGVATTVPYKGKVNGIIDELVRGIKSGLSYSGARTISELQAKVVTTIQSSNGQKESETHILK